MVVAIIDYGVGNLHSLSKALGKVGADVRIERDPRRAVTADALVLPGVGAFGVAAAHVASDRGALREAITGGLPTLGICLGMQLLFDGSEEGKGSGIGVIQGRVTRMSAARLPQIGWNTIRSASDASPLTDGVSVYFANSYVCRPADDRVVAAWATYDGDRFPAAVRVGNTLGVQFHPEKSSRTGVEMIGRFLAEAAR